MPLRDHFRPARGRWDALHGGWPMVIATDLNRRLPPPYTAAPRVHVGALEVDIAAFDAEAIPSLPDDARPAPAAASPWTPPEPTATIVAELPAIDEYEVRVYDTAHGLLVAAIELVSLANKDRPESRGAFVTKCATLLRRRVCVTIVDVVTTRTANLYGELLSMLGAEADPAASASLYAATCRRSGGGEGQARYQNLVASPGAGPADADPAPLARRPERGPPGPGSILRGDLPQPQPRLIGLTPTPPRPSPIRPPS